jgi:hypothetical protein
MINGILTLTESERIRQSDLRREGVGLFLGGEAMTKRGYGVATVATGDEEGYKEFIASKNAAVGKACTTVVVLAGINQVPEGSDGTLRL